MKSAKEIAYELEEGQWRHLGRKNLEGVAADVLAMLQHNDSAMRMDAADAPKPSQPDTRTPDEMLSDTKRELERSRGYADQAGADVAQQWKRSTGRGGMK